MAIVRPENMDFSTQNFSAIIYGSPGVGKTTLALSAPDPVLIDFDHGVSRVRAQHRTPTIMCSTYEEVLQDIKSPDMRDFKTIVIDTGGSFVTFLKDWAYRTKPGAKTKSGDFNGLKGFAFVKSEFNRFTEEIKTVMNKNIIYVFHSTEQTDKDGNPTQRLMCEGSVRNTVWNPCDFGGYVQVINGKRYICFTPEQEYFAKGTHGIHGRREIPVLEATTPNDFMTRLFDEARRNIKAEADVFAPLKEQYETVMADAKHLIGKLATVDDLNQALDVIQGMDHALTSKKESGALLNAKAAELGFKYSRSAGGFIEKE